VVTPSAAQPDGQTAVEEQLVPAAAVLVQQGNDALDYLPTRTDHSGDML
jgi:hypothetical protein